MRWWWVAVALWMPLRLEAQAPCNHTDLGEGVTCIRSANASSANGTVVTLSNFDAIGANLVVITIQTTAAFPCTSPSSTPINPWTPLTRQTASGSSGNQLFYAFNPVVSSTMSFTCSTLDFSAPAIQVAAFSGIDTTTNPLDQTVGTSGMSVSLTLPAVTPTSAHQLMVVGVATGGDPMMLTINSGFTIREESPGVPGSAWSGALAMRTIGAPVATTVSWMQTISWSGAATIATFRAVNVIPPPSGHAVIIGGGIL
jgi:hypothetical protein